MSISEFAKTILGGLNERYCRDYEEATLKASMEARACLVKDGREPSLPIEDSKWDTWIYFDQITIIIFF